MLFSLLGFFSGLINAIAGGGGLLVLPILLASGIPPINALATNKFQAVFGTLSSSFNFYRKGHIDLKSLRSALVFAIAGSVLGTCLLQLISAGSLNRIVPWLLIAAALYTVFSPKVGDTDSKPRLSKNSFNLLGGFGIGFYGGFFGPGMGSIAALSFSSLRGFNLRKATAHAKPVVFTTNVVSMVIFVFAGQVFWAVAIPMAMAQLIGGRVGSNLVIKKGAGLIKPVIVLLTLTIAARMLFSG
ncbi:hypothetical protein EOPP23_07875 [Endozoicomonas sp. OPT23]|nr:hypothetical protein [Endozoicomonas sp. OPT23]